MALVLKTILHAICLPGMIVIGVPWLIMTPWLQPLFPKHYVGLIPFALGFVAMVWCMVEFVARGRGTPLPNDPPKLLVERGPYRWTRNPMYVGVLLMLIGEAVTFASTRLAL